MISSWGESVPVGRGKGWQHLYRQSVAGVGSECWERGPGRCRRRWISTSKRIQSRRFVVRCSVKDSTISLVGPKACSMVRREVLASTRLLRSARGFGQKIMGFL